MFFFLCGCVSCVVHKSMHTSISRLEHGVSCVLQYHVLRVHVFEAYFVNILRHAYANTLCRQTGVCIKRAGFTCSLK